MRRIISPVLILVLLATAATVALYARYAEPDADALIEGKVFGTPLAEIYTDDYDGPPVVGDVVTRLPELAPLQPGNRTHNVRIDIVSAEIDIAPGVRYQAWTFGGSVPGPVIHVREGDRIIFTMKNRSGEQVSVTPPSKGASPFLQALAADRLENYAPSIAPMHHSMDFHAGTVAPDDKWRMIMPGQTIRMEWVANYPGVYLYH